MILSKFIKELHHLIEEIGEERVNSHYSLIPSLHIIDDSGENAYEVTSIEPELLPGCNCWSGAIIYIKKKED